MDVAKYIGLFLLKNNTCHIHGLGNIEWRVKPASYNGHSLVPGVREVVIAPTGLADDSLSNFIATNEQISISKATNAVRDFSIAAKNDLQAGKEVTIPSLGSFAEVNGKLQFNTAHYLLETPGPIPAEKGKPKRAEERQAAPAYTNEPAAAAAYANPISEPTANYELPDAPKQGLNWGRIILLVLLLAAIIGGIGYVVKNMMSTGGGYNNGSDTAAKQVIPAPAQDMAPVTPVMDSTAVDTTAAEVVAPNGTISFKVILNTYETKAKAEKRMKQLRNYGNNVEMVVEDTNQFHVVMPVTTPAGNKQRMLDSLRNNFNPDGVFEL